AMDAAKASASDAAPVGADAASRAELQIPGDTEEEDELKRAIALSLQSPSKHGHAHDAESPSKHGHAHDAEVIRQFLDSTRSQLTWSGLAELRSRARPEELAVFFRNNHFSTLTKVNDELHLLLTDAGYGDQSEIVWEKLSEVNGDSTFMNSEFSRPFMNAPDVSAPAEAVPDFSFPTVADPHGGVDADHLLALQLQSEEGPPAAAGDDTNSDHLVAMRLQEEEYARDNAPATPVRETPAEASFQLPNQPTPIDILDSPTSDGTSSPLEVPAASRAITTAASGNFNSSHETRIFQPPQQMSKMSKTYQLPVTPPSQLPVPPPDARGHLPSPPADPWNVSGTSTQPAKPDSESQSPTGAVVSPSSAAGELKRGGGASSSKGKKAKQDAPEESKKCGCCVIA
ncbi:hypothetical protein CYMTET_31601, partial [Cymbomonas tetramitiformis]